jgi:hypothetical protein
VDGVEYFLGGKGLFLCFYVFTNCACGHGLKLAVSMEVWTSHTSFDGFKTTCFQLGPAARIKSTKYSTLAATDHQKGFLKTNQLIAFNKGKALRFNKILINLDYLLQYLA